MSQPSSFESLTSPLFWGMQSLFSPFFIQATWKMGISNNWGQHGQPAKSLDCLGCALSGIHMQQSHVRCQVKAHIWSYTCTLHTRKCIKRPRSNTHAHTHEYISPTRFWISVSYNSVILLQDIFYCARDHCRSCSWTQVPSGGFGQIAAFTYWKPVLSFMHFCSASSCRIMI